MTGNRYSDIGLYQHWWGFQQRDGRVQEVVHFLFVYVYVLLRSGGAIGLCTMGETQYENPWHEENKGGGVFKKPLGSI